MTVFNEATLSLTLCCQMLCVLHYTALAVYIGSGIFPSMGKVARMSRREHQRTSYGHCLHRRCAFRTQEGSTTRDAKLKVGQFGDCTIGCVNGEAFSQPASGILIRRCWQTKGHHHATQTTDTDSRQRASDDE